MASSLARAGAEKQFVYAARALREAGVNVRVFSLDRGGYYEDVLRSLEIPITSVACQGKPMRILRNLIREFRAFRPQVVVASQFGDISHAGIAGRLVGALIIGGVRNDGFWELNTYPRRSWFMVRLTHRLLANSHRAKKNLISKGINASKINVIFNVIDLEDFDSRGKQTSAFPFGDDRVVVANIGRINPCKRMDRFIDALAIARARVPALAGFIAGADEGERANLEQKAIALGLAPDHLVFLSESNNVPALLERSDILVSASDSEGFPNVILEGMAARLAVVTTPAGDSKTIVQNGVTGFVVESQNPEEFAAKLVRLAQSPDLRRQMGEEARKRVEANYGFERLGQALLSVYADVAENSGRIPLAKAIRALTRVNYESASAHAGSLELNLCS